MKESAHRDQRQTKSQPQLNIMLNETLPSLFNRDIWMRIQTVDPQEHLIAQQHIMVTLLSEPKLFECLFCKFYNNHVQLNNWYLLAHQNQLAIKQYVFKQLLSKTFKEYKEQIRDAELKRKFQSTNEVFRDEDKGKERRKDSFHKMQLGKGKLTNQNNISRDNQLSYQREEGSKSPEVRRSGEDKEKQDYHELFLKTFSACDGSKYIYYDFNRHMRGIEQKKKYNEFIRIKKHRRLHNSMAFKENQSRTEFIPNKSFSPSQHEQVSQYFHEGQHKLEKLKCSKFTMQLIGSVSKHKLSRQQIIFRKMPNQFKKTKPNSQGFSKLLQLRKKKIL